MTTIPPLAHLLAVAEAATPGPWSVDKASHQPAPTPQCVRAGQRVNLSTDIVAHPTKPADALHIATFSPSVALALLGRIKHLESQCAGLSDIASSESFERYLADKRIEELEARVRELEEGLVLAIDIAESHHVPGRNDYDEADDASLTALRDLASPKP